MVLCDTFILKVLPTASTYAACPVWVEADYDTDVNSYTNGEGTPRGYRQTTIPNPETAKDSDYPCITVETENADTQYVEIAVSWN